jgi:protein kinase X
MLSSKGKKKDNGIPESVGFDM